MNGLDVALLVVLLAFVLYGAVKGFVRLVLGAVALAAGIFLGCWYNAPIAAILSGVITNEPLRRLAALGLVLLATLAGFAVLVWFITKTLEVVHLRWMDRLTGAGLGLLIAALLVAALLVPLTAFLPPDSTLVNGSRLSPYILEVSSVVKAMVPEEMKRRFDAARAKMKEAGKGILPSGANQPVSSGVGAALKEVKALGSKILDPNHAGPPADPNARAAQDPNAKGSSRPSPHQR